MGFASAWLNEKTLFPELISDSPHPETGIIVVIPAYSEPDINSVLDSLDSCIQPPCMVEVIVVVNAPENAPEEHLQTNRIAIENIESRKKENKSFYRLFCINPEPVKDWGVGLARKCGMDEALRRFNAIGNPGGVILCLDADCRVDQGYLISVFSELYKEKNRSACSIYFEHPLYGSEYDRSSYLAIALYELHLRYHYQGLIFSGFPDAFHTVGSAMAVKALPYMKAGGMNRKQAGEDFYFIQKLIPAGGFFSINSTTVYPSPRKSFRVPFGTGASMEKMSGESGMLTYNMDAFRDLKETFSGLDKFYDSGKEGLSRLYYELPGRMRLFIPETEWIEKLAEIKGNTSEFRSFSKRFYSWFNMFKIIKYLNFIHLQVLGKKEVVVSATELLTSIGHKIDSGEASVLLKYYRELEKKK
jgi:hypothetical protein